MSEPLPALCRSPSRRRRRTIELAQEADRRGFAGIYVPSRRRMSTCEALSGTRAHPLRTAIAPIYQRTMVDFAQSAAMMHGSGGRFRLGLASRTGRPMCDGVTRASRWPTRARSSRSTAPRPGSVRCRRSWSRPFAKDGGAGGRAGPGRDLRQAACRTCPSDGRPAGGKAQRSGLLHRNMIPTCISDDVEAARATNRKPSAIRLCRTTEYWKEAGYIGNGRDREATPRDAATTWPKFLTDNGLKTTRCSGGGEGARRRRPWRASGVHADPCAVLGRRQSVEGDRRVFAAFRLRGPESDRQPRQFLRLARRILSGDSRRG